MTLLSGRWVGWIRRFLMFRGTWRWNRWVRNVTAFIGALAGIVLLGGCDLLDPPGLDSYSTQALIDELWDRGLGGLFGDDE